MSIVSTLLIRFSITPILSETLAPPSIATNGFFAFSSVPLKNVISFSIKKPATDVSTKCDTPSVELCALWAAPKASFTYIPSVRFANSLDKVSSFFSSLESNLTFSSNATSPSFKLSVTCFALSPVTSFANFISVSNSLLNSFATGFKEYLGFTSPFGLPRWEHNITFAPFSIKYLIVGSAAVILVLSVIVPFSSKGTLKSHLTNTFFPFTSISLTVFLFIL